METVIVEVNENHGSGKLKVKVFSHNPLSDFQKKYLSTLTRDEAIKYGKPQGWNVVDMSEWV